MTYAELVAAVYVATNRPDKVDQTAQSIQLATFNLHSMEMWDRDTVEPLPITFPSSAFIQTIDLTTLTRFRIFRSIRDWDPNAVDTTYNVVGKAGAYYDETPVDKLFDPYYREYQVPKSRIFYLAGDNCVLKNAVAAFGVVEIKYQKYPNTDISGGGVNFQSWIARDHPWAIVYSAAIDVLGKIGNDAAAKLLQPSLQTSINTLVVSHLEGQGR